MPKRRSQILNPPDSYVSGMRDIHIRRIDRLTEEQKIAHAKRVKKSHTMRLHKGHIHKNLSQRLDKKRKQAVRRAAHRKKVKMNK